MSQQYGEPTLEDAIKTIARQAIRISHLEADRASLNDRLSRLQQSPQNSSSESRADVTESRPGASEEGGLQEVTQTEILENQFAELARDYAALEATHAALEAQHATCRTHVQKVNQKYRDLKKMAKVWQDYIDRKTEKISARARDQRAMSVSDDLQHHRRLNTPQPLEIAADHTCSRRASSPLPTESSRVASYRPCVTSSQTTVDDAETQNRPDSPKSGQSNDDSDPVFVHARRAKRTARAAPAAGPPARRVKIKQEPNSPDNPIQLPPDSFSSPKASPGYQLRVEVSDLDVIGAHIATPHRRGRKGKLNQRAISEEPVRPMPKLSRSVSSYSQSDANAQSIAPVLDEANLKHNITQNQGDSGTPGQQSMINRASGALQPIDVNVIASSRSDRLAKADGRRRRDNFAIISEDGDDGRSSQVLRNRDTSATRGIDGHRLDDLLNERSPERAPVFVHSARKEGARPNDAVKTHLPTPDSAMKRMPPPVRPEDEPLRNRSLASLRLEDFKINQKYMGTTYAFSDTLRGRDERRGLHVCMRPDCCGGALQKAIAIGGTALSGKTDAQALEAFLGPTWHEQTGRVSLDKRKELILQAHVYCVSEQHGKHRQAFQRRSTPPGFWNTDFPTTQETKDNRAKALQMDRQAVAERYREAMREGGRWIFRDE